MRRQAVGHEARGLVAVAAALVVDLLLAAGSGGDLDGMPSFRPTCSFGGRGLAVAPLRAGFDLLRCGRCGSRR